MRTNDDLYSFVFLETNYGSVLMEILTFSSKRIYLKVMLAKSHVFVQALMS